MCAHTLEPALRARRPGESQKGMKRAHDTVEIDEGVDRSPDLALATTQQEPRAHGRTTAVAFIGTHSPATCAARLRARASPVRVPNAILAGAVAGASQCAGVSDLGAQVLRAGHP